MATAFVSSALICFAAFKNGTKNRSSQYPAWKLPDMTDLRIFMCVFAPLILLSLPQILCIRTGVTDNFFVFFPGWTEKNSELILGLDWSFLGAFSSVARSFLLILYLWLLNLGILFLLLPLGLLKSTRAVRLFYLPFLLLFVGANLVKFQPWYFDNYKLFLHWYALTVILAAVAIFWLCDSVSKRRKSIGAFVLIALVSSCIFFGVGTHVWMLEKDCQMWSGEELEVAEWVRDNTASDAVFLTGSAHNHPIPSLSGRQRVMGYEGWLWSHGMNWTCINARKKCGNRDV